MGFKPQDNNIYLNYKMERYIELYKTVFIGIKGRYYYSGKRIYSFDWELYKS